MLAKVDGKRHIKSAVATGIPVADRLAKPGDIGCLWTAMKHLKRFVFGMASSILFGLGLARAAENFDPLYIEASAAEVDRAAVADDCTAWCDFDLNDQ